MISARVWQSPARFFLIIVHKKNPRRRYGVVPRRGIEPLISWMRTRYPGPLDERGMVPGLGVEPRLMEPESTVLPLYYPGIFDFGLSSEALKERSLVARMGVEPMISWMRTKYPRPLDDRAISIEHKNYSTDCLLLKEWLKF